MKKTVLQIVGGLTLFLFIVAFTYQNGGAIQGKVNPAESAQLVLAISGRDTIAGQLNTGVFMLNKLKPGTYTVWIKGNLPFRDTAVVNVAVLEGTTTDLGELRLGQATH